jgi:tetratricopeptide (TPR) repeat protein
MTGQRFTISAITPVSGGGHMMFALLGYWRPMAESGLDLALAELHLTGRLLSARAYATYAAGDTAGAARNAAEALRLFRQAGDRLQVGTMLGNLGTYELSAGDLDAARRHLAESLDIARTLNDRHGIATGAFNLGLAAYLGGSADAAGALFAESLDLGRRMGMKAAVAYASSASPPARRPRPGACTPGWCEPGPIGPSAAIS